MKKGRKVFLIVLGSVFFFILLLLLIGICIPESEEMKQEKIMRAERQAEVMEQRKIREAENEKIRTSPEYLAQKKAELEKTEIEKSAKKYFRVPQKDNDSGLTWFLYVDHECTIYYRFYPLGLFKYETELGTRVATNIKLLYKNHSGIHNIIIRISSPFKDDYGNITWKTVGSFGFSRRLYNRIDWSNFNEGELLKVAENVKGF